MLNVERQALLQHGQPVARLSPTPTELPVSPRCMLRSVEAAHPLSTKIALSLVDFGWWFQVFWILHFNPFSSLDDK